MTERRGAFALLRSALVLLVGAAGCGGAAPPPETAEDEADGPPPTFAVALRFEDASGGDEANPRTRVSLVRIAPDGEPTVVDLGEEVGPEPERVVARRALEDEAEAPGTYEEVGEIELPLRARLQILTPSAPE